MKWYYWEYKSNKQPGRQQFDSDATALNHILNNNTDLLCVYRGETEEEKRLEVIWEA